jgi:nicotinamidase-related amidase
VIEKFRSSALHGTALDDILCSHRIQTVLVAGCTTEGCVESTVFDLTFHDYIPVVLVDCVASDHRDLHDASLAVMSAYRADTATVSDVRRCWGRG